MGETPTYYLSTPQAAAVLGLSPRTLESYRVTGGGPPFLTYCNRVHYLRSDLDAWAVSGRRRSTSDDGGAADGGQKRAGGPARANGIAGTGRGPKALPLKAEAEASASEDAILPGAESGTASGHLSVDELAALLQVNRPVRMSLTSRPVAAFPEKQAGRLPHYAFRGLLGVHSRCGPYGR